MTTFRSIPLVLILMTFWLAGCSSDDSPTSSGGATGRTVKADPSFSSDIQEIFNRRGCTASSCHGTSMRAGLDLRDGSSRGKLVGVTATSEPIVRVIPSNADGSYLVIKLEGRQAQGGRMPLGQSPLDNTDLQNIKNWIDQGAQDN